MKSSSWEKIYEGQKLFWGFKPDHILAEYAELVPKGRVLDLGAGEGRNALFFAKKGHVVEGVDISKKALEKCIKWAKKANLKIKTKVCDLTKMKIDTGKYSIIICAWVLNFFKKKDIENIIRKMKKGIKKNGFVYISVFSLIDPSYKRSKKKYCKIAKNTFYNQEKEYYMHYFTKKELLSFFKNFTPIYCVEGTELDITHSKPHYHGLIIYMGKKGK